ncbi:hypothetical protein CDL12_08204 [Handroanthus impetiginosus]|uniref:Uncharacterized protein n=1 Tax=Handroanthus impetiginosus TaxID=429701 RepID=A0A2G9HNN2_9LAMI|nr:hypothetical protein CDL12_08204 [Handroanthus impetiginosus]
MNDVFTLREMVSQTLMIKAQKQQLFSMFYLRGGFCSVKDFSFVAVLLWAVFVLVTSKRCSPNEAQSQLELEACQSYRGNFGTNTPDVFDDNVNSEWVSTHSVQRHSLESVCPHSNLFCFPSTLTGFLPDEVGAGPLAYASEVQSSDPASGLMQVSSNLSWSSEQGIFRLLGGKVISCSLYEPDDFRGFSASDINTGNGQQTDASSCMSTLFDHEIHGSKSGENAETVKSGLLNGFSAPLVEIKPFLLDWGQKNMYNPSLAFLTVKNLDTDGILSIYDPYSSDSQFYPCNFSQILLAPGEVASICFIFFPVKLGLSSAQLVLQTSFGGFLIQAKGFAVESPYLIKPINGLDVSSGGRWRNNLSLFNPFNEALYVEQVIAWISISSGSTSHSSKAICNIHSMEDSDEYDMLSAKEWLAIGSAEGDLPQIAVRPHKNWEVDPQKTEAVMELVISDHFQGKIFGAFCLQLVRSSEKKIETVMVPLEAELSSNSASQTGHVSVFLEVLVPCDRSGSLVVALSVRNDAPYVLSVVKVAKVGESKENFHVKSIEGLVLFPKSVTKVAILNYAPLETSEVNMDCKLLVQINDTRFSQIEIPCADVISVCFGRKLDSIGGYAQGINNVDDISSREGSFSIIQPPFEIEAVDTREADELVLRNWKSQATAAHFMSVLDESEVLFPMVQVGNHCSQWIDVRNPSQEPIVVQLVLNSGEVVDNCRTSDMQLQPPSSSILMGNKSVAPARYGFSIATDALTEAFILPYGNASFGPVLFQPSNCCEWRSSALIRNNLSGVEWLSLRGLGGSLSLVLLEGPDPMHSLEFKLNSPSLLNFSSPEILHAKSLPCSHPLVKEVYAKNMGDFPLEVIKIEVSGSECGLDGFLVHNCRGFSLLPGESIMLQISYQSDFSSATMQRDLELALATGILVIPMKASLPIYLLNFCKRSIFWMRLKKAMVVILFAASMLFLLVYLLFPRVPGFTFQDSKNENLSSTVSSAVNSLSMRLRRKNSGDMAPKMDDFVRSIVGEDALHLESADRCPDGHASDQGHVNSSGNQTQKNSLTNDPPEARLISAVLSNSSPVGNSNTQNISDSQNLRVKIGKDKGRRRRKKKNTGLGVPGVLEVSSSQSGNSTPSSPLSPSASVTPKRAWPLSPDMEQPVETRNPFARACVQQGDKRECSDPSSKVINLLDDDVSSRHVNKNRCFSVQEKSSVTRKLAGKAVLLPSATFPSAGRVTPPRTCHSPILASTSPIAPHARAPGTKFLDCKTENREKVDSKEKFTYDIWGDHLFGLPLTYQSKQVSNMSESFFVRDPQTLMTNFLPEPAEKATYIW